MNWNLLNQVHSNHHYHPRRPRHHPFHRYPTDRYQRWVVDTPHPHHKTIYFDCTQLRSMVIHFHLLRQHQNYHYPKLLYRVLPHHLHLLQHTNHYYMHHLLSFLGPWFLPQICHLVL